MSALHFPSQQSIISKLGYNLNGVNSQTIEAIADRFANQTMNSVSFDIQLDQISKDFKEDLNPFLQNKILIQALLNCANGSADKQDCSRVSSIEDLNTFDACGNIENKEQFLPLSSCKLRKNNRLFGMYGDY